MASATAVSSSFPPTDTRSERLRLLPTASTLVLSRRNLDSTSLSISKMNSTLNSRPSARSR